MYRCFTGHYNTLGVFTPCHRLVGSYLAEDLIPGPSYTGWVASVHTDDVQRYSSNENSYRYAQRCTSNKEAFIWRLNGGIDKADAACRCRGWRKFAVIEISERIRRERK